MKFINLLGATFGRLTVVARAQNTDRAVMWLCACECGAEAIVRSQLLRLGKTKSCGCLRRETVGTQRRTHGSSNSRGYNIWGRMMQRCGNPKSERWPLYGGRGIEVCERWKRAANFLADMGEPPPGNSIERIDVNGNYEPGNCRWATQREQTRNTRRNRYVVFGGTRVPLIEVSESTGISYSLLRDRLNRGWDLERAIAEPKHDQKSLRVIA